MYPSDPSCPHLAHRQAANQRDACRSHAVILLGRGCSAEPVARAWLMEPEAVPRDFKRYRQGGILRLRPVVVRSDTCWRNAEPDPRRVNITGVIDLERPAPVVCFEESIGTASNRAGFKPIEPTNRKAEPIHGICDNARDDRSKQVSAFPDMSKIELRFVSPSAPNLNLMERFWKYLKKQVVDQRHSDTYDHVKPASETYFTHAHQHASQRRSLLSEHVESVGQPKT